MTLPIAYFGAALVRRAYETHPRERAHTGRRACAGLTRVESESMSAEGGWWWLEKSRFYLTAAVRVKREVCDMREGCPDVAHPERRGEP